MTGTTNDFECQECGLPKKIDHRRELCMCGADAARAAECVAAFKPLADAASAILAKPRPPVMEFWVVAKQNPGASDKMMFVKGTTSPTALEWLGRNPLEGSGWSFDMFEDRAGATRTAASWSYRLNQCRGIEFYLPVRVFVDGNQWCAVHADFENLQESDAGFGDTIEAAVRALSVPGCVAASKAVKP